MSEPAIPAAVQALRAIRLGLHLVWGACLALTLLTWMGPRTRIRVISHWSSQLLKVLGVKVRTTGLPQTGGAVYVLNHISWLDIHALHAITPQARFIAKAEVRSWPMIGWLAEKAGTLFLERGRKQDTLRVNREVVRALAEGDSIALFPEGTTTDGTRVLHFKASLLQPAVQSGVVIAPAALRYVDGAGHPTTAAAYIDEMSFGESLARIVAARGLTAEIHFFEVLAPAGRTRRELAESAHRIISARLFPEARHSRTHTAGHPPA